MSAATAVPRTGAMIFPANGKSGTPSPRRQGQDGPARSITGFFSMPCSGFCAPGLPGGTWPSARFGRDRGVWAKLLDAMIDDPDFEWLMIDSSYIKTHPHSAGARGGNQAIARTKGGSTASCTWRWTPTECR